MTVEKMAKIDLVNLPMLSEERATKMRELEDAFEFMYRREGCPYGQDYASFLRWLHDQDRLRERRR